MIELLAVFYVGVSVGAWLVMTIRDGRPIENLCAFLWPVMVFMWLAGLGEGLAGWWL